MPKRRAATSRSASAAADRARIVEVAADAVRRAFGADPRSDGERACPGCCPRAPAHARTRRALLIAAAGRVALATPLAALAQPAAKPARVGFLGGDAASARFRQAFLKGMRDLGLVEGRNVVVEWRFAEGSYERLPGLAAELVRLRVDVIVAMTTLCVQAARAATATIPIVMVGVPDPIGEGFATSLSRPGGNITGLSNIVTEVSSKHLELMLAAVPRLAQRRRS